MTTKQIQGTYLKGVLVVVDDGPISSGLCRYLLLVSADQEHPHGDADCGESGVET